MTTLTLQLPDHKMRILQEHAQNIGMTIDSYIASLIDETEEEINTKEMWDEWWKNLQTFPDDYVEFMTDYLENERKTIQFQNRENL